VSYFVMVLAQAPATCEITTQSSNDYATRTKLLAGQVLPPMIDQAPGTMRYLRI
jgi:hypothetical protein